MPDEQLSMFDPATGKVRRDHPDTARQAATAIAPAMPAQRARVLHWIKMLGPCTDECGMDASDIGPSSWRPRRTELVEAGLVRDSGKRGRTKADRAAILWEVVP